MLKFGEAQKHKQAVQKMHEDLQHFISREGADEQHIVLMAALDRFSPIQLARLVHGLLQDAAIDEDDTYTEGLDLGYVEGYDVGYTDCEQGNPRDPVRE